MSATPNEGAKPYHFYSVDQAMCFGKAVTMGDLDTAAKIYNVKPRIARTFPNTFDDLSKEIKNYDPKRWDAQKDKWMVTSMTAKFGQDKFAQKALQAASQYDINEIDKPKHKLTIKGMINGIKKTKNKYQNFKKNVMKTAKKFGFIEVKEEPIDRMLQNMFLNDNWRPFGQQAKPKCPQSAAEFNW